MCVNCDDNILNEAFEALRDVFRQFGQRNVVDAIHNYYHYIQPDGNRRHYDEWQEQFGVSLQPTLWDRGFGEE